MNKTPLFLVGILLFLSSACLPINKKIVIPAIPSEPLAQPEKPPIRSSSSLEREKMIKKPQRALSNSLKLESDIGYQRLGESPRASVVEEDIAGAKEDNGLTMVGPQLSKEYIGVRLSRYEASLWAWNELVGRGIELGVEDPPGTWRNCITGIRRMVAGYQRLREFSESGSDQGQSVGAAWGLLRRDIHFIEGGCDALLEEATVTAAESSDEMVIRSVGRMESLVAHYMAKEDYSEVISAYENLIAFLPADEIKFTLTQQYANALIYSGRLEEARNVLRASLSRRGMLGVEEAGTLFEQKWRVISRYADLLFVLGDEAQAKELYLRLDDNIAAMERDNDWVAGQLHFLADYRERTRAYDDYVNLLSHFVSSDGRGISREFRESYADFMKKYSEFGLLSGARRIMRMAEEKVWTWAHRKLKEAKNLAAEKDFSGAKVLLGQLRDMPEDIASEVEAVTAEITVTQQEEAHSRSILEREELSVRWQEAKALLEQKEYEHAIVAFASLLNSEHRVGAKRKMSQAIEELAIGQRRQAANLFLQAQKAPNAQEKKELFRRSRLMLVQMLRRYPEIALADKIRRNLTVLDGQIRNFDPDFLESLEYSQKN